MKLKGLYVTKGQRVCDILLENEGLTEDEVKRILEEELRNGFIKTYTQFDEIFYILNK